MVTMLQKSTSMLSYGLFATLFAIFNPLSLAVFLAVSFIVFDAILGYAVSRKFGVKSFQSRRFFRTVFKSLCAIFGILAGGIVDYMIPDFGLPNGIGFSIAKFFCGMVVFSEAVSILEAFKALFPEWYIFGKIGDIIQSKGEKYLNMLLSDPQPINKQRRRKTSTKKVKDAV